MTARLILASSSPRRRKLLARAGFIFEVVRPDAQEVAPLHLTLRETAICNAIRKANTAAAMLEAGVLLACDTLVALEGVILGKPADLSEAGRFLRRLSGRTHQVCSGVCVRDLDTSRQRVFEVTSDVTFRSLTNREIDVYLAKIHPLDKAGGYAAQGAGKQVIARVVGSFTNVVGLPMEMTTRVLRDFGVVARAS